jgi:uncharacterized protein
MKTNSDFWDTSAIIPLCVQQSATNNFRNQWRKSSRVVIWWGTTVEVHSTLSRLYRENYIDTKGLEFAMTRFEAMRNQWNEITPSEKVREIAETLPDAHNLRALDSFQLAAALIWCNEKPRGRVFVCDDIKLSEAAKKAGFTVKS